MSEELDFYIVDDIPEYIFYIADDEEQEQYIPIKGEAGSFKYEKVTELPTTGENGVLYLVPKSHAEQTASGNPISINVTEGAGKLSDLKLDGDTTQQSYTGKNLMYLDPQTNNGIISTYDSTTGNIHCTGTSSNSTGTNGWANIGKQTTVSLTAGTYTLTRSAAKAYRTAVRLYHSDDTYSTIMVQANNTTRTETISKAVVRYYIYLDTLPNTAIDETFTLQLETGSTPSSFEKYVGGIPSPNPSYPQDINVVTGTQTISINGTNYPIDLGGIELAGIGTYQDKIYKSDGKWYLYKEIGKVVLTGSENWGDQTGSHTTVLNLYCPTTSWGAFASERNPLLCSIATYSLSAGSANDTTPNICKLNFSGTNFLLDLSQANFSTLAAFKTWLSSNPTTVYYVLATPTTTEITNTSLIAQLEAVRTAQLANGANTISNTATGSNLAGDLELKYYEYDPTDKYTKWLWINADAAYEQM